MPICRVKRWNNTCCKPDSKAQQQRWQSYPAPVSEGARIALLQTERTSAIAALEQFVQTTENFFARWNASYSLGKTFSPGNKIAIATLIELVNTIKSELFQIQISETLRKVAPGNMIAIATLTQVIHSTQQITLRRKAAYILGKLVPGNFLSISTLVEIIEFEADPATQLQAAENLAQIDSDNAVAKACIQVRKEPFNQFRKRRKAKSSTQQDSEKVIAALEQRLVLAQDALTQRRLAYQLSKINPGHPIAIERLLQLLQSEQASVFHKRTVEYLKEVLLYEQLDLIVQTLKEYD